MKDSYQVMVINDDTFQLQYLGRLLEKAGLKPCMYPSADSALRALLISDQADLPDLIITDLYMPGIDGWRLCRLLRAPEYAAFNAIPILVVSATFAGEEPSRITADLGANGFLPAPVDYVRLMKNIQMLLTGEAQQERLNVLLVEDSSTLANLLKKRFEVSGWRVTVALTLKEAQEALDQAVFELAIIDYHLPDGKGEALLPRIQEQQPRGVAIMMTSDADPHLALRWMQAGAAAYLRKPFEVAYLIQLCHQALRERTLLRVEDLLETRTAELRQKSLDRRRLLDSIDTQVWYLKNPDTYGALNQAHAAFWGRNVKALAHQPLRDFMPPGVAAVCLEQNQIVFARRQPLQTEEWLPNSQGEPRLLRITRTPQLDEQGEVAFVVCAATDITVEWQTTQQLKESESQLRQIFELSPVGIELYDREGCLLLANPACLELFGVSTIEHIRGFRLFEDPNVNDTFKARLKQGETVRYEVDFDFEKVRAASLYPTEKSGIHHLQVIITPLRNKPHADITGYLVLIEDMSMRKAAEDARLMLERHRRQRHKAESLGLMAGAIAHHYNNLLTAVMGNLEMAQSLLPASEATHLVDQAMTASRRAAEIGRLMLAYLGQGIAPRNPLDLRVICRQALAELGPEMPPQIRLEADLPEPGPVVNANQEQIQRALHNLILNAQEAIGGQSGTIHLHLSSVSPESIPQVHRYPVDFQPTAADYAFIAVANSGPGIPEASLEKLFDPFYSTRFLGRGLGLPVALGAVKAHGGCMTVTSAPEGPTVFHMYLPLLKQVTPPAPTPQPADISIISNRTLLVVDDEPAVRQATATAVKRLGLNALVAASGQEALELFQQNPRAIDGALCDLTMPDMDGWQTLKALRRIDPRLPVILYSGYDQAQIMAETHAEMPQAFLSKPFSLAELRAVLLRALGCSASVGG